MIQYSAKDQTGAQEFSILTDSDFTGHRHRRRGNFSSHNTFHRESKQPRTTKGVKGQARKKRIESKLSTIRNRRSLSRNMGYGYGSNESIGSGDIEGDKSGSHISSTDSCVSGSVDGASFGGSFSNELGGRQGFGEYSAPKVASKEQRMVKYSKVLVFLVLLLAVVSVATTTYLLLVDAEQEEFENQVRKSNVMKILG